MSKTIKINFNNKKLNLYQACDFSKKNNIEHHIVLEQAYSSGLLVDKNNKLLINFINYLKVNKKNIESQLYQDIFASFVVNDKFDKTFLEFGATNGKDLSNTYLLVLKQYDDQFYFF